VIVESRRFINGLQLYGAGDLIPGQLAADAGGLVAVLPLLAGLVYAVFMTTLVATAARTRSQREK